MVRSNNELVRRMRKSMGLSQEEMAEHLHINQRSLSRIESGKRNLDLWEYLAIMQMARGPTEDLLPLILESKEMTDYDMYNELKRMLRFRQYSEILNILPVFERRLTTKQTIILQFIAYVKIRANEETPHDKAIEGLYEALSMSIKHFDERRISEYRFTYNELCIVAEIANETALLGNVEKAIAWYEALIKNRKNFLATDADKAAILPTLMLGLSNLLGKAGRHEEAIKYCEDAREMGRRYNNLCLTPLILYNMACAYQDLGRDDETCKNHVDMSYYSAKAIGDIAAVKIIKKDAEKRFGIVYP